MRWHRMVGLVAIVASASSPGAAASDHRVEWPGVERRSGAFAGMAVKVPLVRSKKVVPTARLKLGMMHAYRAAGSADPLATSIQGSALEVGLLGGKPMLFVGGQSTKSLKQRAQLNGGNSWLYVAGGLAIAAAAAFLIFADGKTNAEPCTPGNC